MLDNIVVLVVLVVITQIIPALFFKIGSKYKNKSLPFTAYYLAGNIVGSVSMLFAMKVYGLLEGNPNLAAIITGGSSFVGVQIFLGIVYRKELSLRKIIGIVIAAAGLFIVMAFPPN